MGTCKLCKVREADKNNTHFLTDGIIRSCLNHEGVNQKDKGFYFDLASNSDYLDFNFQRSTPLESLEEVFGRSPNDEEIEKSKRTHAFSVDNVFCSECENKFTQIENRFISTILPRLRKRNLSKINQIHFKESQLIRLFFYLQIWRTFVCTDSFQLTDKTAEDLRLFILEYDEAELIKLSKYPLLITYLETLGESVEYTNNMVGYSRKDDLVLIFMNDFIIHFHEYKDQIEHHNCYGLYDPTTYSEHLNYNEEQFVFRVIHNQKRKEFLLNLLKIERVDRFMDDCVKKFIEAWIILTNVEPNADLINEYKIEIVKDGEDNLLNYTKESIRHITKNFIIKKLYKNI